MIDNTSYQIERIIDPSKTKITKFQKACEILLIFGALVLCALTFPFSFMLSVKFVKDYERIVILRLGRVLDKNKTRGAVYIIPFVDQYYVVDLRLLTFIIPQQQVLTKDSVTITVGGIVFYRVTNAVISIINIEHSHFSTHLLAQTTLRNMIGTYSLHEILTDREKIARSMQLVLDSVSHEWGISIERVEIKDISLPGELIKALSLEAEATRLAKAKIILAEAEKKASQALKNAAETFENSEAPKECITLRYLQTLSLISAEKNSSLIFPFPKAAYQFL